MWCVTLHCITGKIFVHLGEYSLKNHPEAAKNYFLLLREPLKIDNLTTTNAILMKLNSIRYLHETFHLP